MRKKKKQKKRIKFELLLIPILLIYVILNRTLLLYGLVTLFAAVIGFYHDKYNKTPYDLRLTLVFGIIITRHYSLLHALVFFLVSNIIPSLLAGGRLDAPTVIFHLWFVAVFSSVLLFPNVGIILLGLLLVVIDSIVGVFINGSLGVPWFIASTAGLVAFTMRVIYFLTLGSLLDVAFKLV